MACCLSSCHEEVANPNTQLTLDYYSSLAEDPFALNSRRIRSQIDVLVSEDEDSMSVDFRVKEYYSRRHVFLWIDRHGVNPQADTLMMCLDTISSIGLSPKKFRVEQIKQDLKRFKSLNFDTSNTINRVAARLEYNLSKAYMRYVTGQRFGFVNPTMTLNKLDTLSQNAGDTARWTSVHYRRVFDLKMDHAGKHFYKFAFSQISHDSVGYFLRKVQPSSPMYYSLLAKYRQGNQSEDMMLKLLCNMERCRWRLGDYPQRHNKYVIVNIPSLHLKAVDGDDVLSMRVGCGTVKTKTPLLYSSIHRMDINPQWILPRSIVQKDVVNRLGNRSWFEKNHYFVRNKTTGERVPLGKVTRSMLMDSNYLVMQEGGEGNSLGRIIFRFNNAFSVYLHSTSQPGVFFRNDREVSHGCIRVEKPYELAEFMLENKDKTLLDKIKYSMTADVSSVHRNKENDIEDDEDEQSTDTLDRSKLLGILKLKPEVPIFIVYYTLYPDEQNGKLIGYPDVYGYDKVIWDYLKNYR